jgi:hypothetical protein
MIKAEYLFFYLGNNSKLRLDIPKWRHTINPPKNKISWIMCNSFIDCVINKTNNNVMVECRVGFVYVMPADMWFF